MPERLAHHRCRWDAWPYLVTRLEREGEDVAGHCLADLDIADIAAVRATLHRRNPTVVVNCAAWTSVDNAEIHQDAALQVNGQAVAGLADVCADRRITLVQVSTDYVFDGDAMQSYSEADPPSPRTAYGRSKLAGERAVLDLIDKGRVLGYVVRTAWLYGAYGPNFVSTMIGHRPTVNVVDDQPGQPSWTVGVAGQIIVRSGAPGGVYHATSSGETTWFGLAREVFGLLGADPARVRATRAAHIHAQPHGRLTACSAMDGGPKSAWSGSATGGTPCTTLSRNCSPYFQPTSSSREVCMGC